MGMIASATGLEIPEEVMQLPEMLWPLLGRVRAAMPSRGELNASVQLTEHYVFARYPEEEGDEEEQELRAGRGREDRELILALLDAWEDRAEAMLRRE